MPVRIYDISKKLGLENKEVLAKAKELGIVAARVASSSLDKITAEYLEQQLILAHPERAPAPVAETPVSVAPAPEPITMVTTVQIEAPPAKLPEVVTGHHSAVVVQEPIPETLPPPAPGVEIVHPKPAPEPVAPVPATVEPFVKVVSPPPVQEEPVAPPPAPFPAVQAEPAGPKLGDKVGFVQLPPKANPKPPEKPGTVKLPPRAPEPRRADFTKRGDIRRRAQAGESARKHQQKRE